MTSTQKQQSFYSLDDSRQDFTFVQEPPLKPFGGGSSKLVNLYGIKQSSALQSLVDSQEINQSMQSVLPEDTMQSLSYPSQSSPSRLKYSLSSIKPSQTYKTNSMQSIYSPSAISKESPLRQLNNPSNIKKQSSNMQSVQSHYSKDLQSIVSPASVPVSTPMPRQNKNNKVQSQVSKQQARNNIPVKLEKASSTLPVKSVQNLPVKQQPQLKSSSSIPASNPLPASSSSFHSSLQPQSSQNEINQSMYTIVHPQNQFEHLNLQDISQICQKNQLDTNQLECSACLENQINFLSLGKEPTKEEINAMEEKIQKLKGDQSMLRKQLQVFQGLMCITKSNNQQMVRELVQTNRFIKKKCQHTAQTQSIVQTKYPFNFQWPDPSQLSITPHHIPTLKPVISSSSTSKHYDIKPNKQNQSTAEKQLNKIYKNASFESKIVVLDDKDNQYRVEVQYNEDEVVVQICNYVQGDTNFVYACRINQGDEGDNNETGGKISERLVYPLTKYRQKKFTIALTILLLFFKQDHLKQQSNILKIQQIRSLSIPLPLPLFIQPRFLHLPSPPPFLQKLLQKMYIYQIDINHSVDVMVVQKMRQKMEWLKWGWIGLKGRDKLLRVELGEVRRTVGGQGEQVNRVVFRVGTKDKEAQEAIDMIEYMCFMLAQ